jgi:hypothetical protein
MRIILVGLSSFCAIGCALADSSPGFSATDSYRVEKFAEEIAGPEDFEVDLRTAAAPRLLVSAYDRKRDGHGGLYAIPLSEKGPGQAALLIDELNGCPLRPHGISLTSSADGLSRLYVINHRKESDESESCRLPRSSDNRPLLHTVEIFRLAAPDGTLEHEKTLADPLLTSPNELFALSNGEIYLSNEINHHPVSRKLLEFFKLKTTSNVVHYNGGVWRRILTGPRYANGLAVHEDRLYVAGSMDETIDIHQRDPASGNLGSRVERLRLNSAADNLLWGLDKDGKRDYDHLYVAAHPSRLRYMRYKFLDQNAPSPSEVYRIDTSVSPARVERIYYDDGRQVSGASVAVVYQGDLYMGQFYGEGLFRVTKD